MIGDCRAIPHDDNSFALVMMMDNSFGYFVTDNTNTNILKEIRRILKPGRFAVLDIPDGAYLRKNFSAHGWEWIDETMIVCREREMSKDKKRLISREERRDPCSLCANQGWFLVRGRKMWRRMRLDVT